jgi:hypothetical protein
MIDPKVYILLMAFKFYHGWMNVMNYLHLSACIEPTNPVPEHCVHSSRGETSALRIGCHPAQGS